jgi:hypothetical protein
MVQSNVEFDYFRNQLTLKINQPYEKVWRGSSLLMYRAPLVPRRLVLSGIESVCRTVFLTWSGWVRRGRVSFSGGGRFRRGRVSFSGGGRVRWDRVLV